LIYSSSTSIYLRICLRSKACLWGRPRSEDVRRDDRLEFAFMNSLGILMDHRSCALSRRWIPNSNRSWSEPYPPTYLARSFGGTVVALPQHCSLGQQQEQVSLCHFQLTCSLGYEYHQHEDEVVLCG